MRAFLFFMMICATAVWSCRSDGKQVNVEDSLQGDWEILDALRNGRRTSTLKDGFISFDSLGRLSTNILGTTTNSNFRVNENVISSDGDFDFDFNIEKLSGDTMILSGQMRAFNMVFYLMRQDSLRMTEPDILPQEEIDISEDHMME